MSPGLIVLLTTPPPRAQGDRFRDDPALIPFAINEVVQRESPIGAFSRLLARDHDPRLRGAAEASHRAPQQSKEKQMTR